MKTEKVSSVNPRNYIGQKCKILKAEFVRLKHSPAIKVTGESLTLAEGDSLPEGKYLNPSKLLPLVENSDGDIVINKGSKTETFFAEHGFDTSKLPDFKEGLIIEEMTGIECIVQKAEKSDFLDLA